MEFRGNLIFELPWNPQEIVEEIPRTVDQLEKLANGAFPVDDRMEILNYILSFLTEEAMLEKWEGFGNYAKIFLYDGLCQILDKPNGK